MIVHRPDINTAKAVKTGACLKSPPLYGCDKALRPRLMCWLAALALLQSFTAYADVELELKDDVILSGPFYTVADIARVSASTAELQRQVSELKLAAVPRISYKKRVRIQDVVTRVQAAQFKGSGRIKHKGREFVLIQSEGSTVSTGRLQLEAESALRRWLAERYTDYSVTVGSVPDTLAVPAGRLGFQANVGTSDKVSRRMRVWLDVLVDGEHYQSLPIWFSVEVKELVPVAKYKAKKDSRLVKEQYVFVSRDIGNLEGRPLTAAEFGNLRLKKDIRAGEVLTQEKVELRPAISTGEWVEVQLQYGAIGLRMRARADEDGGVGQVIRLRNPNGGAVFFARVTGEGKVVVTEEQTSEVVQ